MKFSIKLHAAASLPSKIQRLILTDYPNCGTLASNKDSCLICSLIAMMFKRCGVVENILHSLPIVRYIKCKIIYV
jgi:hypothetical protein